MNQKTNFPNFLRIAALTTPINIPPFSFEINENKTIYIKEAPLITIVSKLLNFNFKIVHPEDGQYGNILPNKSWTGLVGMVHRGEADLAISRLSYSYQRSSVIHFGYPYTYNPVTFITDKPQYSADNYAILHPFSPFVWLAVILSLMLTLACSFIFMNKYNSQNLLLNICGSLVENSVHFRTRKFSTKMFLFSWVVGAYFITLSYKAVLLSSLTFPKLTGIQDIEELAEASESSSFKCSTYDGSNILPFISESKVKSWKKIADCMSRTNMFTNDPDDFIQPRTYKKAFIGSKGSLKSFRGSYFLSEDSFFIDTCNIATSKSFCCKLALDEVIHKLAAVGLLNKFQKDEEFFLALDKRKFLKIEGPSTYRKLSVHDFFGAFICLTSGYMLSFFVLLLEIFFCKKKLNR